MQQPPVVLLKFSESNPYPQNINLKPATNPNINTISIPPGNEVPLLDKNQYE
jgi:hypothetical protein